MDNCPNCGANVSIYDRFCPYCGRQNHITVDDILNTPVKNGYVSECQSDRMYESYRDARGVLHRVCVGTHRTITIEEI